MKTSQKKTLIPGVKTPTATSGAQELARFLMSQIGPVMNKSADLQSVKSIINIAGKVTHMHVSVMKYNMIMGKKKKILFFEE